MQISNIWISEYLNTDNLLNICRDKESFEKYATIYKTGGQI